MRYDEGVIEQVREANDIVDVVGQHVRLTKRGANYFGLCPFHGEKTPSFSVSPRKQIYYCFGCGAGGNVINFLMEYENYSFTEALKSLADRAHITLPEAQETPYEKGAKEKRRLLLEIHKEAALYYYRQLQSPEGAVGYRYLHDKRKLANATITHFGLGYSTKTPDALYRYLKDKGYTDELLRDSGLVTFTESRIRDKFWNRVMFPIMDTNNRVIGFGGRVMGDGMPKYLNSPETLIFDKSSHLYGLNFARKSRQKFMLLCEGYMDVIALHQAGFTNAVASLGTAFNEKHARLLKRYTDQVILTQDSDEAGIQAKLRAFPILYDAGLQVRVLDMGKYKDPDELIRAEGPEYYEKCIREAQNAFLFMIGILKRGYDLSDPAEKTKFYTAVADRLCMFEEPMERDNYIDAVSVEYMIDRAQLKDLTERRALIQGTGLRNVKELSYSLPVHEPQSSRPGQDNASVKSGFYPENVNEKENSAVHAAAGGGIAGTAPGEHAVQGSTARHEKLLLTWMLERPELKPHIFRHLRTEDFSEGIYRDIAEMLQSRQGNVGAAAILDRYAEDEEARSAAAAVFSLPEAQQEALLNMSAQDLSKGLTEAVQAIVSARIDREMAACGSDMTAFGKLLQQRKELRSIRIEIRDGM